jgi:hypothetical protein
MESHIGTGPTHPFLTPEQGSLTLRGNTVLTASYLHG